MFASSLGHHEILELLVGGGSRKTWRVSGARGWRRPMIFALAVVILPAFSDPVAAQDRDNGVGEFLVQDGLGEGLPGVQVGVRGPSGEWTVYTGPNGLARLVLPIGTGYTATFSLQGFPTVVRDGLEIAAGRALEIEVTMGYPPAPKQMQSELARHREVWDSCGPDDYVFVFTYWSAWTAADPYAIRVNNGVPQRVWVSDLEREWVADGRLKERELMTVDDLFDELQEALLLGASDSQIDYHPVLGFPTAASVDYPQMIDEEFAFQVALVGPPDVLALVPAAESGDINAQYLLGHTYLQGDQVPRNEAEGMRWIRMAAEQGHTGAQVSMGANYLNGHHVEQDDDEAVRWYRLAATQGDGYAMYVMGEFYADGRAGMPQDYAIALEWYRRSAEQGDAYGQMALGRMYELGRGVEQDVSEAERLYKLSAEQGNILAMRWLRALRRNR